MTYQQPAPMPGPYQSPIQQPVKKKSNAPLIIGIIVGALLLCCGGGVVAFALIGSSASTNSSTTTTTNVGDDSTVAPSSGSTTAAAPAAAKLNQPVRDGMFEFTVTNIKCGVSKVGDAYLNKKAQGQFCLVTMTVKNIGKEARTFDATNQTAFGTGGVKYDSDGSASLYANDANDSFLNDINPGNKITVKVVWDIPKDGKITGFELHDSAFSGGVTVML